MSILAAIALAAVVQPPTGRTAFLEPVVRQKVFTDNQLRVDPFFASQRVFDRTSRESGKWGWKVKYVNYRQALTAQRKYIEPKGTDHAPRALTDLAAVAKALKADYLVLTRIDELIGTRTIGMGARTTGRANLRVRVYDANERAIVWDDAAMSTSSRAGSKSEMQPRVDQAYINALREALDPFFEKGYRQKIDADFRSGG